MKRLPKGRRKLIVQILIMRDGNTCCWCNKPMEVPVPKQPANNRDEMVTVEHFFSKQADDIHNIDLLKLAHKKCNK